MSYQTIIIVGNLGKDPEMRYTPNGSAVTSLNVASSRTYTDSAGQKVKETTWFRVSVWGKQAESVNNYLKKGNDGTPGASFEVNARNVRFLTPKAGGTEEFPTDTGGAGLGEPNDEDFPF
jgi:single-strand DNA-binding protein